MAAMAVGFGVAAAYKHGIFDELLARLRASSAPAAPASAAPPPSASVAARASASPTAGASARPSTDPSAVAGSASAAAGSSEALLSVRCRPSCRVWVGKETLGLSPVIDAPLPPGKHRVVVYRAGFGSKILMVDLLPGQRASYDVTMIQPVPTPSPPAPDPAPPDQPAPAPPEPP
jgi:hypothetical protein